MTIALTNSVIRQQLWYKDKRYNDATWPPPDALWPSDELWPAVTISEPAFITSTNQHVMVMYAEAVYMTDE